MLEISEGVNMNKEYIKTKNVPFNIITKDDGIAPKWTKSHDVVYCFVKINSSLEELITNKAFKSLLRKRNKEFFKKINRRI